MGVGYWVAKSGTQALRGIWKLKPPQLPTGLLSGRQVRSHARVLRTLNGKAKVVA